MKKLIDRARQVVRAPKLDSHTSSALQDTDLPNAKEIPDGTADNTPSNEVEPVTVSKKGEEINGLAQSISLKWHADPHCDLTTDMRELWTCYCDAAKQPKNHQQLVDLVKTIVEESIINKEGIDQQPSPSPWSDLPEFKPVVEQTLRHTLIADLAWWTALNHLLARISLPPGSIYNLRMACLWDLRDVLETPSMIVTADMLKTLMMWMGGHIHWLQLQILRAHSRNHPVDTLIPLDLGYLPSSLGEKLQPIVDFDRLQFWRRRLQGLHDAEDSGSPVKFFTRAVLKLLEVGIAGVDEWKEELPAG